MKTFLYLFFLLTILSFVTTSCVKETKRPDSIDAGSIESATEFEVPAVLFLKTGGVLISNAQSKLYALNAVSGAVIWEKAFDDYNSTQSQMPCIKNNTLYYITQQPGVVYAVNDPVKTNTVPTISPGRLNGKITLKKASTLLAPKLSAACTNSGLIFSITPTKEIIIIGKKMYTVPIIIACSV